MEKAKESEDTKVIEKVLSIVYQMIRVGDGGIIKEEIIEKVNEIVQDKKDKSNTIKGIGQLIKEEQLRK